MSQSERWQVLFVSTHTHTHTRYIYKERERLILALNLPFSVYFSVCSARGLCYYGGLSGDKTLDGRDAKLECLCSKGYLGDGTTLSTNPVLAQY